MLSEQVSITKLTRHKINSTTFPQPNRIFVTLRETLWNRLLHVCNSERIPVYLSGIPYHPGNMFSWNHFTDNVARY